MDQNEEIFLRFMNDGSFQTVVTNWMASEAYRRLPGDPDEPLPEPADGPALPPRLRIVTPRPEDRYVTCVPLLPLDAAAGAFSDPQQVNDQDFEWVAVETSHRLRRGVFVARVVGKSMEPTIPDGAHCLFRVPVEGTRQGKIVLVQMRDATDPEHGQRYTVKRYESAKVGDGTEWRHTTIRLRPMNPEYEPVVLTDADAGQLHVVAEVVAVFDTSSRD